MSDRLFSIFCFIALGGPVIALLFVVVASSFLAMWRMAGCQ